MKRNIITSVLLLLALILLGYFVYSKAKEDILNEKTSLSFIPSENTFLIINAKNIQEQIQQIFSTNLIWSDFAKSDTIYSNLENKINIYDSILEKNNIKLTNTSIAFLNSDSNAIDFILVSELKTPLNIDSIKGVVVAEKNSKIYKYNSANHSVYFSKHKEWLICSNKKSNLINLETVKSINQDSTFLKVYETRAQKNNSVFLYANIAKVNDLFNLNFENHLKNSSWSAFDLKINQDAISGNGFLLNPSLNSISQKYSENFINITPSSINKLSVINFNTIKELNISKEYLKESDNTCNCDFITDGLGWIENQIIYLNTTFNNAEFIAFKLNDINSFKLAVNLLSDSVSQEFLVDSSHYIKSYNAKINLSKVFNKNIDLNFYTIYDDYAIFGNTLNDTKHLIYELNANRKLKKNEELYAFYQSNSDESSFLKKIEKGFLLNNTKNNDGVSIIESSVKENNLVYTNFSYSKEISVGGSYHDPKWEIIFDNPIIKSIHFIENHKINDKEILIQDTSNTIYFVSTSGNVKWKKKILGEIIGKVKKVDIFNNGKYQMLFNTKSTLYLVDVLGRDVENFPVNLINATNPVVAFDYDKNGDYRFIVATEKGILNFNKEGKQINGWKKPLTKNVVLNPIRHLDIETKDYLFVNDAKGKIYLFSRQGDIRYAVKSNFVGDNFPIDLGNTIETSRGIYWDKSRGQLKKHFFNNNINTIVTFPDSIINFYYLNFYDENKEKNYILETKNELYIYDKGGNVIEIIPISPEHTNLSISKSYIAYTNNVTHDFILLDKKGVEILRSSNVDYFSIDDSSLKTRILLVHNNKLQMIIPKE